MRSIAFLAAVLIASLVTAPAFAQPGNDPEPEPYPGAGQPPPPPAQQPVQMQPRTVEMSFEERELILRGEIDPGLYVAGGLVGTFLVPFGVGQAIQGRWSDRGWIFAVGEGASIGLIIAGAVRFDESDGGEGLLVAGILGLVGFRIWEMVDLWVGPALHNQRVRGVYRKYGIGPHTPVYGSARPFVLPTDGGGVGGFTLQF